jgi:uncharacterized protein YaaR (DUF327 family)
MDRIGGLGSPQPFLPRKEDPSTKKGRKSPETTKTGFLGFLGRAATPEPTEATAGTDAAGAENALEGLLDEVYASGQDLARNPSPENIVAYKKAVGRFIRQVVDGSLEIAETEGRLRKDMKKPKYALLHVIDEKLEKLGAYVLSNQKDKLEILRKVDELHGLLVDLKH